MVMMGSITLTISTQVLSVREPIVPAQEFGNGRLLTDSTAVSAEESMAMKKSQSLARTVKRGCAAAVCSVLLAAGPVFTADHADSPSQRGSLAARQADINDIYAFMNPNDGNELILAMTIGPDASGVLPAGDTTDTFSSSLSYNYLIQNYNGAVAGEHLRITCTFPTATTVSCSLGDLTVSGDVGTTTQGTGMRVYTGLRDDPFFFNGAGLAATLAAGTPMFEVGATNNPNMMLNGFANQNILGLVIGVDRNLLTDNQTNPVLRLWAATAPL